jgi:diketogulonate reductase-like aldo/keto reductase
MFNIPIKTLNNGFSMPVFGLGTWQMGGRQERNPDNDDSADIKAIKMAIDNGITHIDTAEMYANGYSETLLGQVITGYNRKNLFIASKVYPDNLNYQDLINSAKNSLKRLNTPFLDLYMLHNPNPEIPIQETMKAMDFLIDQGLIRNIGISNFTKERMAEAQKFTKNKIVVNQVHYNLQYREPEKTGLLEYCQKNDVMLVAWRPIQKGLLLEEKNELVDEMCQKYNKTPAQIAINWLISQKNVVTLSKMGNPDHLMENLGALDWEMSPGDVKKLDKNYPNQQPVSNVVPLI